MLQNFRQKCCKNTYKPIVEQYASRLDNQATERTRLIDKTKHAIRGHHIAEVPRPRREEDGVALRQTLEIPAHAK